MSAKDRYDIYRRGEDKPICVGLTVLEALHFRLTYGGQNYSFETGADEWGRPCLKLWINGGLTRYTTRQVGEGGGGGKRVIARKVLSAPYVTFLKNGRHVIDDKLRVVLVPG
jgi:hypothetical protein